MRTKAAQMLMEGMFGFHDAASVTVTRGFMADLLAAIEAEAASPATGDGLLTDEVRAYAEAVADLLCHVEGDGYERSVAGDDLDVLERVHRRVIDTFDPLPFDLAGWLSPDSPSTDPNYDMDGVWRGPYPAATTPDPGEAE